mgnify:CR=1 FL=1
MYTNDNTLQMSYNDAVCTTVYVWRDIKGKTNIHFITLNIYCFFSKLKTRGKWHALFFLYIIAINITPIIKHKKFYFLSFWICEDKI